MIKMKKRKYIGIIIAVCLIISGFAIILEYCHKSTKQDMKDEAIAEALTIRTEPWTETEQSEKVPQKIDFQALWNINSDAYAYIDIPDTGIYYPILQSTSQEEDYYLNVTLDNTEGLPGSLYTQKVNSKEFDDWNTIIYGHEMLDGTYFGSLYKYKEKDYFDSHKDIYIYLQEKRLQYQIIAEVVFDDRHIPSSYDMQNPQSSVVRFMDDLKSTGDEENQFAEDCNVDENDKLLVLSTCIGERADKRRLIVAKLIEEREIE